MKSDIPRLMAERGLDAIVVQGNTDISTDLAYLTGGITLEGAMYLQKAGAEPVLFASPIEREKAEQTGYRLRLWSDYPLRDYMARHGNDRLTAQIAILNDIFREYDVCGRVAFYGTADRGYSYRYLSALAASNTEIEVVGESWPNLFHAARQTKDAAELEAMRTVGELTAEVIASVITFVRRHRPADGILCKEDGTPLTIGDVKAHMRMEMARRDLEEKHETIFSQGRDAGVPHNTGRRDEPLYLGRPIIFDIFPRHRASGYFHDVTRTFWLGYMPDEHAQHWQRLKDLFDELLAEIKVGSECRSYQARACDYFEALGYPTIRSDPRTQVGYTHSLGHGVGLDIHEAPSLNLLPDNDTVLKPGHVISVEPGLYYPDEGWGIRIEDTVALDESGNLINLSCYPYDPVISLP
ncbi:MAG: aminopeptidase P family protein [Caldilineae bacterium]|nr:MAG: aminopeptidase P family protein [Caldilineae bacterium]